MPAAESNPTHDPGSGRRAPSDSDPWTTNFWPRESAGFERLVFFSDAVIAIALTLAAVEIGTPEAEDPTSPASLWAAIVDKGPQLTAYALTFFWVAVYWKANHRFTTTLRGISGRYITVMLVYLAAIALLPFTASTLGEYPNNAVAVAALAVFVTVASTMEIGLILVAQRDDLYLARLSSAQLRYQVWGAATPLPGFLISIPVAFASPVAGVLCWFIGAVIFGWLFGRRLPALDGDAPPQTTTTPEAGT